jgi:excisionase family DNA binding protein
MCMFNEKEVAERLNCKVSTLRKWRLLGSGPAYVKVGRLVRYREADLIAYLDAHCVQPGGGQ